MKWIIWMRKNMLRFLVALLVVFSSGIFFRLGQRPFNLDLRMVAAVLSAYAGLMGIFVLLQKQTREDALIKQLMQATACCGLSLVCLAFFAWFSLGLGIQGPESNFVMTGVVAIGSSLFSLLTVLFLFKALTLAFEALWKSSGGPPDLLLP